MPPECFTRPNDRAPKIDNRVDVWSIGVIFYQCIYGKKVFFALISKIQQFFELFRFYRNFLKLNLDFSPSETINRNNKFWRIKPLLTPMKVSFPYFQKKSNLFYKVNFPVRPPLSQDAKDFIRSCLIYRKEDRADIFSLASHHYLKESVFYSVFPMISLNFCFYLELSLCNGKYL